MNAIPIENYGSVVVRVRSGYGFFPLEDVLVTVFSEDAESSTVLAMKYTNESGISPELVLPATVSDGSTEVMPIARKFTIEASKPGYQTAILHGIQVYPGVLTVQNINLAPLPDRQGEQLTEYDTEMVRQELPVGR